MECRCRRLRNQALEPSVLFVNSLSKFLLVHYFLTWGASSCLSFSGATIAWSRSGAVAVGSCLSSSSVEYFGDAAIGGSSPGPAISQLWCEQGNLKEIDGHFVLHIPPYTVPGSVCCATLMQRLVERLEFQIVRTRTIWSLFRGSFCMRIVGNYKAFASHVRPAIIGAAIYAKILQQAQDEKSASLREDVPARFPDIFS